MTQKFRKRSIMFPIGLFIIAATIAISQFYDLPDAVTGILLGVGIGITAFPLILTRKI